MFMKPLQRFFTVSMPCKGSDLALRSKIQKLIAKYEGNLEAVNNARPEVEYSSGYLHGQESQLETTIDDLKELLDVMDE